MHVLKSLRLAAVLLVFRGFSFAQTSYEVAQPSAVLDALRQYQEANNGSALANVLQLQQGRYRALSRLMLSDPAAVLANALPSDIPGRLPAQAQAAFEKHVALLGTLEVSVEDGPSSARTHYALHVGSRQIGLHFAGQAPANLLTGMPARVSGVQVGEELALNANSVQTNTTSTNSTTGSTAIVPNTFGVQKTLVILVNFLDNATQPYTADTVYGVTFTDVSGFYSNSSFQQTSLQGDVAGWFTLPINSPSTCDSTFTNAVQSNAKSAASKAGYVLSNYTRFVFAFPRVSACTWWGTSNIGGNPSNSWINGGYQLKVVAHEMGHQFGLYHSHSLNCGTSVYSYSGCTVIEYGDALDMMGSPSSDDFTASQKERLGWLNYASQPTIATVTTSGTYQISPYELAQGQPVALKVAGPNGTFFYVESRQPLGNDTATATNANVVGGVLLHNYTPGNPNTSYLLNARPGTSFTYPALAVGSSYTDSVSGVTITPVSVSSSGASVNLSLGSTQCVQSSPTISLSGPSTSVAPGSTATFTATIKDNDSAVCGASSFSLASSVPSGWSDTWSVASLTLSPGSSQTIPLYVTSPTSAPNGSYLVAASAANSSASQLAASASASETVYAALPQSISVATSSSTYLRGQMISATATVTTGTAAVSGAAVSVRITKANGSSVTLSGTSSPNGTVTVSYKIKKNDPAGAWSLNASTSGASASTNVTIQ